MMRLCDTAPSTARALALSGVRRGTMKLKPVTPTASPGPTRRISFRYSNDDHQLAAEIARRTSPAMAGSSNAAGVYEEG